MHAGGVETCREGLRKKPLPFGNYRRDLLSFEVFVEVVKPLP